MIWGGLRGAVGLALALQVAMDHKVVGNKVGVCYVVVVVVCLYSPQFFVQIPRDLFDSDTLTQV